MMTRILLLSALYAAPAFAAEPALADIAPGARTNDWNSVQTLQHSRGTTVVDTTGTSTGTPGAGRTWEASHVITGSNGGSATANTTGQSQKTETGRSGSSVTTGMTENGKTWITNRDVEAVRNEDGTVTVERDAVRTNSEGKTVTRESTSTVTKTPDGRSWTTNGTTSTPKGTGSWTGSGSGQRTDSGAIWNSSRQGTSAGGRDWTSSTQGSGTRSRADGTVNTTRTRSTDRAVEGRDTSSHERVRTSSRTAKKSGARASGRGGRR